MSADGHAAAPRSLPETAERIARQLLRCVWEFIKTNRRKPSDTETAQLLEPIQHAETKLLTDEQAEALGVEVARAWPAVLVHGLVEQRAEQERRREMRRAKDSAGGAQGGQEGGPYGP